MLDTIAVPITTAGGAGASAGTATTRLLIGQVVGIYIDYDSQPATTDVTIATATTPTTTLLTVTSANTNGWFYPSHGVVSSANAVITDSHAPFYIADQLTVSVAQGDDGTFTCYIQVWRD